jgi:hypothetical protein
LTYTPFDATLQRNQGLSPFYSDQFTLGLMKMLSSGSLKGRRLLDEAHDDLLLDAFCIRNTAGKNGRVDTTPKALRGIGIYEAPGPQNAPWLDNLPENPLLEDDEISKVFIVRFQISPAACDTTGPKNRPEAYRLPATHFRMVGLGGRSYYPVAYLTYDTKGGWKVHPAPREDDKAQIANLIVARPFEEAPKSLVLDWVYTIPREDQPTYVFFRRTARKGIRIEGEPRRKGVPIRRNQLPPSQGALNRNEQPT